MTFFAFAPLAAAENVSTLGLSTLRWREIMQTVVDAYYHGDITSIDDHIGIERFIVGAGIMIRVCGFNKRPKDFEIREFAGVL
jgi:hypothetical protein